MIDYPSEIITYFSKQNAVNSAPSPVPDDRRRAATASNVSSVSTLRIEVDPLATIVDPLGNGATLISDISARVANITAKLRGLSAGNFSADPLMAPFILDITQALGANITINFDASSIAVQLPSERMMPATQSSSVNNNSLSMGAIVGITLGVILLSSGFVGKVVYDAHSAKSKRTAAAADIVAAIKEPQLSTISAAPSPLPDSATPGLVLRLHAPTRRVRRISSNVTFPNRTKSIASIVPIAGDDENSVTVVSVESPVRRRASKPEVKPEEPTPRPRIMSFNGDSSLIFHTDSNSPGEASLPGTSQAQDYDSRDGTTTKSTIAETTAWVNELIATYAAAKPLPPRCPLSPTPLPCLEAPDSVANLTQTSTSARARLTLPARQASVSGTPPPPVIVVETTPRSPLETEAREVVSGAFFRPRTREPLGSHASLSPLPQHQLERRLSSKTLKWMASSQPLCISPPTARASIRSPSAMEAILQLPTPVRAPPPLECESSSDDTDQPSPLFTRSALPATATPAEELKQNFSDAAQTAIARTLNIFRTHWPIQPAPPSSNGSMLSLHGATPMDSSVVDSPLSPYPMPPEGRPHGSSAGITDTTVTSPPHHHPARLVIPQFAVGAHRTLTRLTMRNGASSAGAGGVSLPPGPPPGRPKTPLSVEVFRSSLVATSTRASADARAQVAAATAAASMSPTHPFAATAAIYSAPVAPIVRVKLPPRGLSLSGPGIDIDRVDSLVGRRVRRRDGGGASSPGSIASLGRSHRGRHHDSSPDSAASPGFIEAAAPRVPTSTITRPLHITRLTRLSRQDTSFNNGSTPVVETAAASNVVVDAASRSSSRGLALHPPVGAMRLNLEKLLRVVDGNDTHEHSRDPVPTAETIESEAVLLSLQVTLEATRSAREKSTRESKD